MARKKAATEVFDPVKFGTHLRNERRRAGFSNTKDLSKALQEKTGTFIDFDTLLKFERGEREPDISKLIALSVVIYGDRWDEGLVSLASGAMPDCYGERPGMRKCVIESQRRKTTGNAAFRMLERELNRSELIAGLSDMYGTTYTEAERWYEFCNLQTNGGTLTDNDFARIKKLGLLDENGRLVEPKQIQPRPNGRLE